MFVRKRRWQKVRKCHGNKKTVDRCGQRMKRVDEKKMNLGRLWCETLVEDSPPQVINGVLNGFING